METLNMINSRKAVREYSGQITDEQLNKILIAANAGPVGMGNYDDYRLTVIQNPNVLSKLNNIYDAPTVVVVSAKNPSRMEYISSGAIVHNMELAAEDLGIGANYNMACIASIPEGTVPEFFNPVFAITLGQTSEKFVDRKISLEKIKTNIVK
ncbi:nitroreductase family protein [Companilactobacillus jidongensis]|uniref:nitroreductase family protein n=1 Tax=Companilactobacillus jidongensis TaxID=2486006 RepID=UPI000F7A2170|nr:nitroreductase family protein [Companilactobacillus jidongensis]